MNLQQPNEGPKPAPNAVSSVPGETDMQLIASCREHFRNSGPNLPFGRLSSLDLADRLEKRNVALEDAYKLLVRLKTSALWNEDFEQDFQEWLNSWNIDVVVACGTCDVLSGKCANPRHGIEFPLKNWEPTDGTDGFCPDCLKAVKKVLAIQAHVEKHGINPIGGGAA